MSPVEQRVFDAAGNRLASRESSRRMFATQTYWNRLAMIARTLAVATILAVAWTTPVAHAQTYTLRTVAVFPTVDGDYPRAGLTMDSQGNLFGTTTQGGPTNQG